MTERTLLVTGGAGFIGTNFVLGTVASGFARVINVDKLTYAGNVENLAALAGDRRHVFVEADICDRDRMLSLLEEHRPTAIVNFAAESHVDRSIDSPGEFVQTNVVGTFALLEATRAYLARGEGDAPQRFRFLHVSTDEVFGSLGRDGVFREETAYAPNSPYAASKASADHFVRAYHHTYGLPTLTTNCSNNYGPYQFPEKLIPLMVQNALEWKALPVYGDGSNVRDWLYVEDHCDAIRAVLERGRVGESYLIGGRNERTNLELVGMLCALLDELAPEKRRGGSYRELVRFVRDRPGHDLRYAIDPTKIERELGWKAHHALDSGLEKTVRWYLANPQFCASVAAKRYDRERLGTATRLGGSA
jgi:dTDP-glucose 4,6-dehydratase